MENNNSVCSNGGGTPLLVDSENKVWPINFTGSDRRDPVTSL